MTDKHSWRDYTRSQAVLMGAWDYQRLPPGPAAHNSLDRMAGTLTGPLCTWPVERLEVLRNPPRRDNLPDRLMELFDGVTGIALFYFVGHGQLHNDELALALCESPEAGPRRLTAGLPFADVRMALRECDAAASETLDQIEIAGTYVLTASPGNSNAVALPGQPYTAFTGALLDLLRSGSPHAGEFLTLGEIYRDLRARLRATQMPEPQQTGTATADLLQLVRNRQHSSTTVPPYVSPTTLAKLPDDLRAGLSSRYPRLRAATVHELAEWLDDPDPDQVLTALTILEDVAANDIPTVATVARTALQRHAAAQNAEDASEAE